MYAPRAYFARAYFASAYYSTGLVLSSGTDPDRHPDPTKTLVWII